ncbi:MAG: response regulator [Pseudomonadota bacterium]|nr:response regulator [Pseudomonadota bacterium]
MGSVLGATRASDPEVVVQVLLVDDNPANLVAMSAAIEGVDTRVVTARSGNEALRHLLDGEFAAILMDVQMPGMDGFETAELIRRRPRAEDTPIIFITAINQADDHVARGYALGAVDYVFKPVPAATLRAKVSVFVELARKQAVITRQAEQLRRSEARYRQLVEGLPAVVYTARLETFGASLYLSRQVEPLLGFYATAWEEDPQLWARQLHPDDRARVAEEFRQAVASDAPFSTEYRMLAADGRVVWVRDEARVVHGGLADAHVQGVRLDVTDRRLAQEALREANENLRAQADALRKARDDAEFSSQELEMFNSAVAHDLRAPLRSINGFSEALLLEHAAQLDLEGQDLLRRVIAAGVWMGQLIDDLLNLSHCTRSQMRQEPVNLGDMARSCLAQLAAAEPERRVQVRVAPGLLTRGDPRLLRAALENLLRNAWKFTSHHPAATIEVGRDLATGAFYVRDDGAGFDMAYLPQLFQAFQRLHRQDEFEGNGIGLITVKRIIERHGGRVWGTGAPERGATFSFTLGGAEGPEAK